MSSVFSNSQMRVALLRDPLNCDSQPHLACPQSQPPPAPTQSRRGAVTRKSTMGSSRPSTGVARQRKHGTAVVQRQRAVAFISPYHSGMLIRCARVDRERAYDRLLWDEEVADLGGHFSRKCRMSLSSFSALADELRGDLHRVEVQAVRRYGRQERGVWSLAAETQLAVALRFFAGGSYFDVCSSHKLQYSTFYVTLHRVIKAIHKNLSLPGNLHSVDGRAALSDTLRAVVPGNPMVSHTVGALDGIAIRIRGPSGTETSKPAEFFGKKRILQP